MKPTAHQSTTLLSAEQRNKDYASLKDQVGALIRAIHPKTGKDRRRLDRTPVPLLFQCTPLDADALPLADQTMTIVGKDISSHGMSFFHEHPLPFRRALVWLDCPTAQPFAVEIDIRWCRFVRAGWYLSGGRLIRAADARALAKKAV